METAEYQILRQAMLNPDDYALRLQYLSKAGELTERVVSPIKMADSRSVLALCLCRESPRKFELDRCTKLELVPAHDVLMPMEIRVLEAAPVKQKAIRRKKMEELPSASVSGSVTAPINASAMGGIQAPIPA